MPLICFHYFSDLCILSVNGLAKIGEKNVEPATLGHFRATCCHCFLYSPLLNLTMHACRPSHFFVFLRHMGLMVKMAGGSDFFNTAR